jgi:nitrate reductase NapE component
VTPSERRAYEWTLILLYAIALFLVLQFTR